MLKLPPVFHAQRHTSLTCVSWCLQFVIETRPTGQEREMVEGRSTSIVGTEEKIVQITKPNPCGGVPTTAAC